MQHRPTTVLIAEDDPVFRRVMGFTIGRTGLTVESVDNGQAAYERLIQGGVDFLVIDHQMPICTGLELIERWIQHQPEHPLPPTILCTAKGWELDSEGLQSRFDLVAVMHKPFSPRKLSELILKHVAAKDADQPRPPINPTPINPMPIRSTTIGAPTPIEIASSCDEPGVETSGN